MRTSTAVPRHTETPQEPSRLRKAGRVFAKDLVRLCKEVRVPALVSLVIGQLFFLLMGLVSQAGTDPYPAFFDVAFGVSLGLLVPEACALLGIYIHSVVERSK